MGWVGGGLFGGVPAGQGNAVPFCAMAAPYGRGDALCERFFRRRKRFDRCGVSCSFDFSLGGRWVRNERVMVRRLLTETGGSR